MELLGDSLRGIGNPNIWVIASAGALEYARQGIFSRSFRDALEHPATGASASFLSLDSIMQAVNSAQAGGGGSRRGSSRRLSGFTGIPPFFPNPYHRPGLAGLTVAEQHWLSRLRAAPEESTTGFYLTGRDGRVRAATDLAAWITDPGRAGMAVVTGSPGAGKSALLALLAFLAQDSKRTDLLRSAEPASLIRQAADHLPPDTPLVAVHARGLNTDQVAGEIARALRRGPETAASLLEDLDQRPAAGRQVVIVDAVDEAPSPAAMLGGFLLPLARQPGLSIVVGTRRHLLTDVRQADLVIDLDSEAYRDPLALADYIYRLLTAAEEPNVSTPYQTTQAAAGQEAQEARAVARAIAKRATSRDGRSESFLIGRLLALSVRARAEMVDITSPEWQSELPASVAEAFEEDLGRLGSQAGVARALLRALAWAKGPGLPWEYVWARVATELARAARRPAVRFG